MPYREKEIKRIYWTIGQVAEIFNVATSCIRFWLDKFEIDHLVSRDHKGDRKFQEVDIMYLRKIHELITVDCYRIEGARRKFEQWILEDVGNKEIAALLDTGVAAAGK